MKSIAIIGSSISALMGASYLKQRFPDYEISIIGNRNKPQPIVGESLTEYSSQFLRRIGLLKYLEEQHYHKYGLTFYFKEKIENPKCQRYSMHEALAIPPLPSNQVNRFELDKALYELALSLGVKHVDDRVTSVSKENNKWTLACRSPVNFLNADYLIDASGRNRFLTNRFNLDQKVPYQRCSFWFRLANFDRSILKDLELVKPPQYGFDSYYVTHHFFGKGSWTWCIPLKSKDYEDLISVGVVWRPDVNDMNIRNVDQFIDYMDTEHPVLSNFVKSGEIVDTNLYTNYLYSSSQVYSEDRWFLLGDAGYAVDPLYSTGIVMSSIQSEQIGSLVESDCCPKLTREFDDVFRTTKDSIQLEISRLYEVMHDPYQSSWRMHFSSLYYFYFLFPLWMTGAHHTKGAAAWMSNLIKSGREKVNTMIALLGPASERLGRLPAEEIKNIYGITVNWDLHVEDPKKNAEYIATMLRRFAIFRYKILRHAAYKNWITHFKFILQDLLISGMITLTKRGKAFPNGVENAKTLFKVLPLIEEKKIRTNNQVKKAA